MTVVSQLKHLVMALQRGAFLTAGMRLPASCRCLVTPYAAGLSPRAEVKNRSEAAAAANCPPALFEGTEEAYKAAACHYRGHRSRPADEIHNYLLHITLIGPTEVIGNP